MQARVKHVQCMCSRRGQKLVFYDSKADVLLLDIPESIPDHFHAYKVGFDAAEEVPNRAVAIHHPAGQHQAHLIRQRLVRTSSPCSLWLTSCSILSAALTTPRRCCVC